MNLLRAALPLLLVPTLVAQQPMPSLSPAEQEAALDLALRLFRARSVDAAKASEVEQLIQRRRDAGEFAKTQGIAAFCEKLQADLQAVTHDPHGMVVFRPQPRPVADPMRPPESIRQMEAGETKQRAQMIAAGAAQNFAFVKAERLDGDIGYLRIDGCYPGCGPALASALGFLGRTKALILDLRENGGGDPDAGMQVASCFLRTGNRLLETEHYLNGRIVHWRTPARPAARYLDRPVFVLTSPRTFSAGESMAYDLQALKIAQIVGEGTPGGAGTVTGYRIHPNILMGISISSATSDITGASFQCVGLKPDLPCPEARALSVAHMRALEAVLATEPEGPDRDDAQQALDALRSAKNP